MSNYNGFSIKRYSAATFMTGLFSLVFVAIVVALGVSQFLPNYSFLNPFVLSMDSATFVSKNGDIISLDAWSGSINGVGCFLSIFKMLEGFGVNVTNSVAQYLGGADNLGFIQTFADNTKSLASLASGSSSLLLNALASIIPFAFAISGIFYVFMVIMAVILLFASLLYILAGGVKKWGTANALSKRIFVLLIIYLVLNIGLLHGSVALYNMLADAAGVASIVTVTKMPTIVASVLLGVGLISRIIISSIYRKNFKGNY